jgi:hypothetical protein
MKVPSLVNEEHLSPALGPLGGSLKSQGRMRLRSEHRPWGWQVDTVAITAIHNHDDVLLLAILGWAA